MIDMVKNFNLVLKEDVQNPLIGFHVTRRKNLNSIKKKGIEPKVPWDYGTSGDVKGVYLFKNLDDTKNALYNWFGERIEEWEEENDKEFDEVCLKVDLSGLEEYLIDSVEYEWTCVVNIDPTRIIEVFEI